MRLRHTRGGQGLGLDAGGRPLPLTNPLLILDPHILNAWIADPPQVVQRRVRHLAHVSGSRTEHESGRAKADALLRCQLNSVFALLMSAALSLISQRIAAPRRGNAEKRVEGSG